MTWTLTASIDEYAAGVGGYLRATPVEHTVELGALQTLLARGPNAFGSQQPIFGWWRAAGEDITAAAFHTPPYPMLLSGPPEAMPALAAELAARSRELPGVNGPDATATLFAAAWRERAGLPASVHRRSRLFRLGQLTAPVPRPPGTARLAGRDDIGLLRRWFSDFSAETNDVLGDAGRELQDRVGYGGLMLWEVSGTPVSMAGCGRPASGVVRVGPVFTPAAQRGRGFGGAATAAVSRAALDAGAAEVVLFTDLANPTSNALYARIGYRPVSDRVWLAFGKASGS
jgi:RimJ/RimL family protein N-acetyltransferase